MWDGTKTFPLEINGSMGVVLQPHCPYAHSLADVASEHFSFQSAESGVPQESVKPLAEQAAESGAQDMSSRIQLLETSVADIANTLNQFISGSPEQKSPPILKKGVTGPSTSKPMNPEFPMLDPGVVQAALAGGVDRVEVRWLRCKVWWNWAPRRSGLW